MNYAQKMLMAIALLSFATVILANTALASSNPSISAVPDKTFEINSGAPGILYDLRNYATDPTFPKSSLNFEITSQTNARLIDCFIEAEYFLKCSAPRRDEAGFNTLNIMVTNPDNLTDTESVNIIIAEKEQNGVEFSASRDSVSIGTADTINVGLEAANYTNEKICFTARAQIEVDDRRNISADISQRKFCLAKDEKTSFTISISSEADSQENDYIVVAQLEGDSKIYETQIRVDVTTDEDDISIERTGDYYICRDPYVQDITLRLSNNTSSTQNITLSAQDSILLPSFEFEKTRLGSNDSTTIEMQINTSNSSGTGDFVVPIVLESENFYAQKDILFHIKDCGTDAFTLKVTPKSATISRGSLKSFDVLITSNINSEQQLQLGSSGEFGATFEREIVTIPSKGSRKVEFTIKVPENAKSGEHTIYIEAWNNHEQERESVEISVRKEHSIELLVANNNFEARICTANARQTYEVTVKNNGSYDETVRLDFSNTIKGVEALISDKSFELRKGREEKILVFVNPGIEAAQGDHKLKLRAKIGNDTISEDLKFRVIQSAQPENNAALKFTSYPRQASIAIGEEKTLTFSVKNTTGAPIENVSAKLYGILNGPTATDAHIGTIAQGATKTFTIKVLAAQKDAGKVFYATIEIAGNGAKSTAPVTISVANDEGTENNDFLSGLAVLFGGGNIFVLGLMVLALLLIISTIIYYNGKGAEQQHQIDVRTE